VLHVLVEGGGVLNSEAGLADPLSPETKLVAILRDLDQQTPANSGVHALGGALGAFLGTTPAEVGDMPLATSGIHLFPQN
jgi:hypothetical protein